MVFIIFGGLYFDLSTLPTWLRPLSSLSPVKLAWDGFVANEFAGLTFEDAGDQSAPAGTKVYADGVAVLSEIGLGCVVSRASYAPPTAAASTAAPTLLAATAAVAAPTLFHNRQARDCR